MSIEDFDGFCISSKKKDTDINLYLATDNLFEKYTDIDSALINFETDKTLVPLMMQQNYMKYTKAKYTKLPKKETLQLLANIANNLSMADVTDGYVYSNQSWDLQEIYGFYSAVNTCYQMNRSISVKKNLAKQDAFEPCYKYDFTVDLNKTSIKNINNIADFFPCKSVIDYVYLNKIINYFIKNEQYDKIGKLLNYYKVSISEIDSLLKIDKINNSKNSIKNDIKNEIIAHLNIKKNKKN